MSRGFHVFRTTLPSLQALPARGMESGPGGCGRIQVGTRAHLGPAPCAAPAEALARGLYSRNVLRLKQSYEGRLAAWESCP